ncbi:hypothetical protein [Microbulbifer sp. DLAB2-AA]|uniref:hypothetical protein n=1 Tax=Microbulbifer sp. DLAB2-AA TaxID=3243394 RepID=UPI00403A1343
MEEIYNLFFYSDDKRVSDIGCVVHRIDGSDEEKLKFLQAHLENDSANSKRYEIPHQYLNEKNEFTNAEMRSLMRLGRAAGVFEKIFLEHGAPASPLMIITPVLNGAVHYDIQAGLEALPIAKFQDHPLTGAGTMPDYLEEYMNDGALDIGTLIHNDHYIAVKQLFNSKHYLSAMKLMVSFIDTLGYLDSGDVKDNVFVLWLKNYGKSFETLGITAEEFWEFRNSILHMTNLDSRRVKQGKVKRVSFMVGPRGTPTQSDHETTYFNFADLIFVVQNAIENWLKTYVIDPHKLSDFVKRYDRVISDSRMAKMP